MQKVIVVLLSIFSCLLTYAAHPEGECGFRTLGDEYINLWGDVRIVPDGEPADLYVRIYEQGDEYISDTPEMYAKWVDHTPRCCGEFRLVDSDEDYTICLVKDASSADIVFFLGEPCEEYQNSTPF